MARAERPKLSEALKNTPRLTPQVSSEAAPLAVGRVGTKAKTPPRGGRAGTRQISIYVGPKRWAQLSKLKIDRTTSLQELGIEAFDLLCQKYGLPRLPEND